MANWDLTDIFKTKKLYYEAIETCLENVDKLCSYQTIVVTNINEFLELYEIVMNDLSDIVCYGTMNYHLDMSANDTIKDYLKSQNIESEIKEKLSWFIPEIVCANKNEVLNGISDENREKYTHFIEKIFDNQEHVLSPAEEKIIVSLEKTREDIVNTYDALMVSDRKGVDIKIGNKLVQVNSSNYNKLLSELEEQADREKVFTTYYQYFEDHSNTVANMYNTILSINSRIAKFHGYKSSLDAKLNSEKIPVEVYKSLIRNVKKNCIELQSFLKYREKELGLEQIHTYDRLRKVYSTDKQYTYESGLKLCFEAAKGANDDYFNLIKTVLQDGWVDVYPKNNKRGGAYSWRTNNSHPYILHNYDETLNSVYTLMHEAGHSVHSYLSDKYQSPINSNYSIYVAEVASTFAECLLTDYLLANEEDENLKKTLVEENILRIISTLYRQTLFAEFEYIVHELVDNGQVLTKDTLNQVMQELYFDYYGINLETEALKKYVWMYIGHLYFAPFYVYQYATCITASFQIYDKYCRSKEEGLAMLYGILKQGGSDYPNNILLDVGIDLTKDEAYSGVFNYLKKQVEILVNS